MLLKEMKTLNAHINICYHEEILVAVGLLSTSEAQIPHTCHGHLAQ